MDDEVKWPDYVGAGHVLDQAMDKISKALYKRQADFLFGSGMSKTSNIPLGTGLAVALLEEFFPKASVSRPDETKLNGLAQKYPLEVVAEAVKRMKGGEEKLAKVVETVLSKRQKRDDDLYNLFSSICFLEGKPLVDQIFTTNLDCLFEEDSGKKWVPVGLGDSDQLRKANRGKIPQIPVIHLHGLFGQRFIITETDIFDWEELIIKQEFKYALTQAEAFVFVGYSMSDPDIRAVYMKYRKMILARKYGPENHDTAVYIVSPPDNEFDYTVGSSMWGTRGALWIPLDALSFFKKLRHFLVYESGSRGLKDLKDRLYIEDEAVLGDKVGRIARLLRVKKEDAVQFLFEARSLSGGK
jgi:hypothetical protein